MGSIEKTVRLLLMLGTVALLVAVASSEAIMSSAIVKHVAQAVGGLYCFGFVVACLHEYYTSY